MVSGMGALPIAPNCHITRNYSIKGIKVTSGIRNICIKEV